MQKPALFAAPALLFASAALLLSLSATGAQAGPIQSACLRSDRDAANRSLCSCIQQVADMTLVGSDQRRAAKFFSDPDKANETWLSQRASDDAFWDRYKNFGQTAEAYCAG
jgi:hypothetical protein